MHESKKATQSAGEQILAQIKAEDRMRTLVPSGSFSSDPEVIDLTSNDYLDLRNDSEHQEFLHENTRGYPFGSGGSRLLGGEHPVFQELESAVCEYVDAEATLFFPSGFAANESVGATLGKLPGACFFSDTLNHASIIDGIRAARLQPTNRHIFKHNDLSDLKEKLTQTDPMSLKFIFTESLFSMDGDCPNLSALQSIADVHDAILVVDEAHAFFCLDDDGRGLSLQTGVRHREMIRILTCGKALSLQGAFVCGPRWFRDLMINTARPFIYTTAPSPVTAAAALATIKRAEYFSGKRRHLEQASTKLRTTLNELGFATADARHHIIPIICGENKDALALSEFLGTRGISSRAIRPPTVPQGTARVRLSLHAGINGDDLSRIIMAFTEFRKIL